jgi:sugar phosphate permease
MKKRNRLFYGWWMVVAITIMYFIIMGSSPFAVVLKQLMEQFHTGRGEVSLGSSISSITGGVVGIFVGILLHRHKPRPFILAGSIVSGLCSLLTSLATNIWYFYALCLIAGAAGGFCGAIASFTLLARWFSRKWGTVVGITQAGGAVGSLVIMPLVGFIAENLGWQVTYLFTGGLVLAINVPLVLFVLKDSPETMGLLRDGDEYKEIAKPLEGDRPSMTLHPSENLQNTGMLSFLKNPALWLLGISFAFIAIGDTAVTTHEVSFITDMKISAVIAASALGLTLGIGGINRVISGWLSDRISSRYVTILFILLEIAGMLFLIQAKTMSLVWIFVVLYGLGAGASLTLLPIVTRDLFGSANFSRLFGFVNILYGLGFAVGVPLAGFMFDATGSYSLVFILIMIIYLVAIMAIYLAFGVKPQPLIRLKNRF